MLGVALHATNLNPKDPEGVIDIEGVTVIDGVTDIVGDGVILGHCTNLNPRDPLGVTLGIGEVDGSGVLEGPGVGVIDVLGVGEIDAAIMDDEIDILGVMVMDGVTEGDSNTHSLFSLSNINPSIHSGDTDGVTVGVGVGEIERFTLIVGVIEGHNTYS